MGWPGPTIKRASAPGCPVLVMQEAHVPLRAQKAARHAVQATDSLGLADVTLHEHVQPDCAGQGQHGRGKCHRSLLRPVLTRQ